MSSPRAQMEARRASLRKCRCSSRYEEMQGGICSDQETRFAYRRKLHCLVSNPFVRMHKLKTTGSVFPAFCGIYSLPKTEEKRSSELSRTRSAVVCASEDCMKGAFGHDAPRIYPSFPTSPCHHVCRAELQLSLQTWVPAAPAHRRCIAASVVNLLHSYHPAIVQNGHVLGYRRCICGR